LSQDSDAPGNHDPRFYHKVNIQTFLAGIIAGILALSKDPWWTLQGEGSSQIITLRISPFYMETYATGLGVTTSAAVAIGALTRFLVGVTSLLLIISSVKTTVWWRNLAQWFNITAVVQMFLSLAILINTARQELLAEYGVMLPLSGRARFPANVLGLDLRLYQSPMMSAGFGALFYAGVFCLFLVATERLMSLRGIEVLSQIRRIRELDLLPPYKKVWIASDDRGLNPLSEDPERVTDEQLMVSFGNIFRTVEPGGIVRILLPSWAGWVGDRIQGLVKSVGFKLETTAVVREQGQDEIELRLKKPIRPTKPLTQEKENEAVNEKRADNAVEMDLGSSIGGLEVNVADSSVEEPPPIQVQASIVDLKRQLWSGTGQINKREMAMVRSAARVILGRGSPVEYRELLSGVYRELLEHSTGDFGSIREIESALLRHVGQELVLIEEESPMGVIRKWWIGDEPVVNEVPHSETLEKMKGMASLASTQIRGLRKRFRMPKDSKGYRKKRAFEDEGSRT
jgi:hypothetical protein